MVVVIEVRDLGKVFPPNIIAVDKLSLAINEGKMNQKFRNKDFNGLNVGQLAIH